MPLVAKKNPVQILIFKNKGNGQSHKARPLNLVFGQKGFFLGGGTQTHWQAKKAEIRGKGSFKEAASFSSFLFFLQSLKLLASRARGPGFDSRSRHLNVRDWLSPATKSRFGWNTACDVNPQCNQPMQPFFSNLFFIFQRFKKNFGSALTPSHLVMVYGDALVLFVPRDIRWRRSACVTPEFRLGVRRHRLVVR